MATPFPRSGASLDSDGFGHSFLATAVTIALLGAWLAWFFLAGVDRYEVTEKARLEVDRAAHLIQAPIAGRVDVNRIALGRQVTAGEVLLELDRSPQILQLAEERARLLALAGRLETARLEITSHEKAQADDSAASGAAQEVARAQLRETTAMAELAAEEAKRDERLSAEGLTAGRDVSRSKAAAQSRSAAAESLQLTVGRLERERIKNASDREAILSRLRGEIARIEGDVAIGARTVKRLEYEIERRIIRAPISGRFGEVAQLRAGSFVDEGDKLGAIVPAGRLRAVAEFLPASALGRIRPGQPARLRLDGFPWAQYGAIHATVETVGEEVRDGRIRVELTAPSAPDSPLPLQHGLPGTVEVRVERIAPVTLALRAAGQLLAAPRSTFHQEPAR